MRTIVEKITKEYSVARQEPFSGHPLGSFFRNEIPKRIYNTGLVDSNIYLVTGSVGQGNWVDSAWFAIFNRSITTSARQGVYIVYLLSKDGDTLYLTFNQGCEKIRASHTKKETIGIMRKSAREIAQHINSRGFNSDENISLGDNLTERAELYQKGTIFYRAYHKDSIPSEEVLRQDLQNMLDIYAEYVSAPKPGEYDSWEIVDEVTAIKTCDKSFFEYKSTGVPKEICWFFDADNIAAGTNKMIKLVYGGRTYSAKVSNDTSDRRRISISWYSELGTLFSEYKNEKARVKFVKVNPDVFEVSVLIADRAEQHAWLLAWNPTSWKWKDIANACQLTMNGDVYKTQWACSSSSVKPGDTVYITVLGWSKNGIIASGRAITTQYEYEHWDAERRNRGEKVKGIDIELDHIINPADCEPLSQGFLKSKYPEQHWSPQASGISIKPQYIDSLGTDWMNYISDKIGGEKEMTTKEQVAAIRKYIEAKGFNYDGSLIENFYLGLKSKPFVILAGTSGTGKTRLVRLFAEAIKAEYKLVSVRPDWSDSSDLFGHVDLNQKFVPGAIIDFVKQAELNPNKPYFLCLDEMNLARVEYYMSDILSAIETRRYESGIIITDPVVSSANYGNDPHAPGRYGKVILPGNLYIVGTVNMDETTFPFSKKVLDRANTIEFSYVDLLSMPSFSTATADKITVTNNFLVSKYITLNDCDAADRKYIGSVCTTLSRINGILEIANAHIGYRVRDEIVFYMLNNREADLLDDKVAFDNQIMQKILPRVQGSSESIKTMLGELLKICESEKYEASAKKINFMIKRYEEDGFTSYWL